MVNRNPQPKSPLSIFFSLGDKVTKGDPKRKMDFDYYMMWIIFLAFFGITVGNLRTFFLQGYQWQNLGWALFGTAIMWFQYFNLKTFYIMRENMKKSNLEVSKENDEEIETVQDMMEGFK